MVKYERFQKINCLAEGDVVGAKIYSFTNKLPADERFGLISQIRRCAVSIPSNISEGAKRSTDKDFRNFINFASGSSAELETQLLLSEQIYNLKDDDVNRLLVEIQKMLESLIKKL